MLTRIGILETEKGLSSDFSSSLSLFQKKEKERLIKNFPRYSYPVIIGRARRCFVFSSHEEHTFEFLRGRERYGGREREKKKARARHEKKKREAPSLLLLLLLFWGLEKKEQQQLAAADSNADPLFFLSFLTPVCVNPNTFEKKTFQKTTSLFSLRRSLSPSFTSLP